MMNTHTSRVQSKFDLDKWRERAGAPGHKLIARGAQQEYPKVREVVVSETGFLGAIHGDEKMGGGAQTGPILADAVDTTRTRYRGAIDALPQEVRREIAGEDVGQTIDTVERAFRGLMQSPKATPAQPTP